MTRRSTRIVVAVVVALAITAVTPVVAAFGAWTSTRTNDASVVKTASIGASANAAASAPFACAATTVTWTAASGATSTRIERSLDAGATWTALATPAIGTTTYTDSTVASPFTARYRVAGSIAGSAWTGAASTTTDVTCANARNLTATVGEGSTRLAWATATDATGYEVQRRIGTAAWTTITPSVTAATFVDTAQQAVGTVVTYRVRAVRGSTTGPFTETASVTWTPAAQDTTVTRTITNDWTEGYCASVTVRNDGASSLAWRIQLAMEAWPYQGTVTQQQNATTISTTNSTWTVEGVSWNRTLAPGASTSFTYCAMRPTPPVTEASVTLRITSEWSNGYCAAGTVTTTSVQPITWRVTLTRSMAPFTDARYWPTSAPALSNAATVSYAANAWVVGGTNWNPTIAAGQTREFSFCAAKAS